MASLPQKGMKGDNFKKWAIDSINKLIDYLSSPYLQNGKGIAIRRTPSGTIIELEKQPSTTPQSSIGGGGTQDISNTTGNNPSIGITGSTSAVEFVGTGDVTITGNTNGQIEVNFTGGGGSSVDFPNYETAPVSVSANTLYPIASNMWLIGYVGLYKTSSSGFPSYVTLVIYNSAGTTEVRSFDIFIDNGIMSSYNSNQNFDVPVCIPIKSNHQIKIISSGSVKTDLNLFYV